LKVSRDTTVEEGMQVTHEWLESFGTKRLAPLQYLLRNNN